MWRVNEHQFANKKRKTWAHNNLGKNICNLQLSTDTRKGILVGRHRCHRLNDNQLRYVWCVHEKWGLQWFGDTCIIGIKRGWLCLRKSKFSQKTTKPNYFLASSKHGTILGYNRWFRYSRLFLTFPWDQWRATKHAPTGDRMSSIKAFLGNFYNFFCFLGQIGKLKLGVNYNFWKYWGVNL